MMHIFALVLERFYDLTIIRNPRSLPRELHFYVFICLIHELNWMDPICTLNMYVNIPLHKLRWITLTSLNTLQGEWTRNVAWIQSKMFHCTGSSDLTHKFNIRLELIGCCLQLPKTNLMLRTRYTLDSKDFLTWYENVSTTCLCHFEKKVMNISSGVIAVEPHK